MHFTSWMRTFAPVIALVMPLLFAANAVAQQSDPRQPRSIEIQSLKQLSIDELAEQDVTGASRRLERLADVAYAVQVISADDLRRAGVTTLTQALRLADVIHVAQVFGPAFAVSARGFNISTMNKMLVLIDGRAVYSPIFAGVFWETQDLMIADIERIEIIRGPGGSVWGANAVNGVINVIMKRAADTRGTFVDAAAGSNSSGPYAVRYGGRLGSAGSYRAYGKWRWEDEHQLATGVDAGDTFRIGQFGFRAETQQTERSFALVQGDLYRGSTGLVGSTDRSTVVGGNLLARASRGSPGQYETRLQLYYDRSYRRVPNQYRGVLDTFDVDAQHQRMTRRQTLVAGAGFRVYSGDDHGLGPGFVFEPRESTTERFNLFVQDEIAVQPSRFFLTLGTKLEHNGFTGFELQPTVRARWNPAPAQTVWGSISRAVRVPSRFDTDLRILVPNTSTVALSGSDAFKSETLIAYEAGYRSRVGDRAAIDVAVFNNRYDDLRSQEFPSAPGQPIVLANLLNATTRGIELTGTAQVTAWWQAHASYARLWENFLLDPVSRDPTKGVSEYNDPNHVFKLRSSMNPTERVEIEAIFRRVSALPHPVVEAYSELEARIGWRVRPGWDLSLIGHNLLAPRHIEFAAGTPLETFERALTVRSTWRF